MRTLNEARGDDRHAGRRTPLFIQAATLEDLDAMLRIEQASFTEPWTAKMIHAELVGNPFATFLVARAEPGGGVKAHLCYWLVFEELRLLNLAVDPSVRRQGIATELVQRALADGRRSGTRRAVLEVRASNHAALALYRTFGFEQTAVRTRYYARPVEDAILMELNPMEADPNC